MQRAGAAAEERRLPGRAGAHWAPPPQEGQRRSGPAGRGGAGRKLTWRSQGRAGFGSFVCVCRWLGAEPRGAGGWGNCRERPRSRQVMAPRGRGMRQHSLAGEAPPALCTTPATGFDRRIDGRGPGRPCRRAPPQLPLAATLPPLHLARLLPARHLASDIDCLVNYEARVHHSWLSMQNCFRAVCNSHAQLRPGPAVQRAVLQSGRDCMPDFRLLQCTGRDTDKQHRFYQSSAQCQWTATANSGMLLRPRARPAAGERCTTEAVRCHGVAVPLGVHPHVWVQDASLP